VIVTSSTRKKAPAKLSCCNTGVAVFRLATGKLGEMRNKDIKVLHLPLH